MYVIIVDPADKPLTIPVEESIVATEVLLLLHVPPDVELLKVVEPPTQRFVDPDIAETVETTVTIFVTVHPATL